MLSKFILIPHKIGFSRSAFYFISFFFWKIYEKGEMLYPHEHIVKGFIFKK